MLILQSLAECHVSFTNIALLRGSFKQLVLSFSFKRTWANPIYFMDYLAMEILHQNEESAAILSWDEVVSKCIITLKLAPGTFYQDALRSCTSGG